MGGCESSIPLGYSHIAASYDIQWERGLKRKPGIGAFAKVRVCTHLATYQMRAVKCITKANWNIRREVMEEISVLRAVSGKHCNIITFFEWYEEWEQLYLIFEYCAKGSLEKCLQDMSVSHSLVACWAASLLEALLFLEQEKVLHRDVKPANVLLNEEGHVKLSDFGCACFCSLPQKDIRGTPAFFAPEVLQLPKGKGCYFPGDVWAAGVTIYMLLFNGKHPFMDHTGEVSRQKLKSGDFQIGWTTSGAVADLLEWMLMPCPDQRITVQEALEHRWFASHGLGPGSFAKEKPRKLILDSQNYWLAK